MIAVICVVLLVVIVGLLSYVSLRLSKKLLQFDELFEMMTDEFDTNIRYFDKLLATPLFMATPEIEEAHKNMQIMSMRLEEYVMRMGELRGKEKKKSNRPQVV